MKFKYKMPCHYGYAGNGIIIILKMYNSNYYAMQQQAGQQNGTTWKFHDDAVSLVKSLNGRTCACVRAFIRVRYACVRVYALEDVQASWIR